MRNRDAVIDNLTLSALQRVSQLALLCAVDDVNALGLVGNCTVAILDLSKRAHAAPNDAPPLGEAMRKVAEPSFVDTSVEGPTEPHRCPDCDSVLYYVGTDSAGRCPKGHGIISHRA